MLRRIPPLEAAEAFIAVARTGNMRAAAERLALSPSAVSRRVQSLEDFLGVRLFLRRSRGLSLTSEGKTYLERIEHAFDALEEAALSFSEDGGALKIAASHTLSAEWLMPRLPRLSADLGLPVDLIVGQPLEALREGRAEIALCGGFTPPAGCETHKLASGRSALVAAPDYSQDGLWAGLKLARPQTPLMNAPADAVSALEIGATLDLEKLARAPAILFATLQMAYEAAASGLGVALAVPLSSERFLAQGRIAVCENVKCDIEASYWLAARPDAARRRDGRLRRLQNWLSDEACHSMTRFQALT